MAGWGVLGMVAYSPLPAPNYPLTPAKKQGAWSMGDKKIPAPRGLSTLIWAFQGIFTLFTHIVGSFPYVTQRYIVRVTKNVRKCQNLSLFRALAKSMPKAFSLMISSTCGLWHGLCFHERALPKNTRGRHLIHFVLLFIVLC